MKLSTAESSKASVSLVPKHFAHLSLMRGPIHFVGIGGVGMSSIARILCQSGVKVQGSDLSSNDNTQQLIKMGASVWIGHKAEQVEEAQLVVYTSAARPDNPELTRARQLGIPTMQRGEMLAEIVRLGPSIAVAGSHGKTTITSMIATILDAAKWDPTVINGGVIRAYASNARMGKGSWMVVESDESDGSFLHLFPCIGLVSNIDPEHMDHYGTFADLLNAYERFCLNLPFYGSAIMCEDHASVRDISQRIRTRRHVRTYGVSSQADVHAHDIRSNGWSSQFDVVYHNKAVAGHATKFDHGEGAVSFNVKLNVPGMHNIQNALGAVACTLELGILPRHIMKGLAQFQGIERRFSQVGIASGATIVDDYAHHPVEIHASLDTARAICKGKLHAVFQPHRFSRYISLAEEFSRCFACADHVWVSDVYAAGEANIAHLNAETISQRIRERGHPSAQGFSGFDDLVERLARDLNPGDMVVFLGAGSVSGWAKRFAPAVGAIFEISKRDHSPKSKPIQLGARRSKPRGG